MKHPEGKILGLLLLATTVVLGGAVAISQTESTPQSPRTKAAAKNVHANGDRGQKVFQQNCARCHNAPEGFSARISGTVAMHMRVRAGLSEADVKALRRFLNP
jgi:cytochrome c5